MARREYPGVYPYPAAGGRTLYRASYTDSSGVPRQKRGFTSPSAAAKFRARMQVRAERGELRITRETFAEHFDGWLKGHHRASKATRDGYRASGERRLKPYFGPMRLSAIDVQVVRNFASEMVEAGRGRRARSQDRQQHAQLPEHVPEGRRRAAQDPF